MSTLLCANCMNDNDMLFSVIEQQREFMRVSCQQCGFTFNKMHTVPPEDPLRKLKEMMDVDLRKVSPKESTLRSVTVERKQRG